jgi:hypothetical protein
MSWLRKSDDRDLEKLDAQKEKDLYERENQLDKQLQLEARRLNRLKKEKTLKKERWNIEHPKTKSTISHIESGAGRLARFTGSIAKDTERSYSHLRFQAERRARRMRGTNIRAGTRSFVAPEGNDISMSGGIARNQWAGERNIMNTNFFGQQQPKDILGTNNQLDLTSNKNKKNVRYF